jgi:uncharacterized protein
MTDGVMDLLHVTQLEDWGPRPNPLSGAPRQAGLVLAEHGGGAVEFGIWECTPGSWKNEIAHDELCHVLKGCWRVTSEDGETLELTAGDSVFRPLGSKWTDEVVSTVRTVYMLSSGATKRCEV